MLIIFILFYTFPIYIIKQNLILNLIIINLQIILQNHIHLIHFYHFL